MEASELERWRAMDLGHAQAEIQRILLGGKPKYTRLQIADKAGISPEQSRELWRALGFAAVDDDVRIFTDADLAAVRIARDLLDEQVMFPDLMRSVTRMLGQTMSRTADWQGRLITEVIQQRQDDIPGGSVEGFVEWLVPRLEQVLVFTWRRHLAAFADHLFAELVDEQPGGHLVVGFADLSGYTRFSRQASTADLEAVLEEFEGTAFDVITGHRGRVVKTLGDEVLFTVEHAEDAAEIALQLIETCGSSDHLPPLHIGLAQGEVLGRFGDVYGPVVNLAKRLTSAARPGAIAVDRELAGSLDNDPRYELRRLRDIRARGYRHLQLWTLSRAKT